ncbi:carbohydrate kinase family protein [Sporichthya sp.]|uniref:carbohydrate kinase family protein n=1 Tax=Sporichthya sp. TaxID=65475 RepID=UPI0017E13CD4|nr:carbohydrate kinase family protein [Sporichthya sp.]MBA3744818.1 carbohydrate kinase family protein [Sporichthya sp.]
MKIAVTGSIATDHLMTFEGRFADSFVAEQLAKVSLSFLVEDLEVRRGGVAANIAFGMGCLGLKPALVGAVGEDFEPYRSWLERHGVDTESVKISELKHTARFVCTTDQDQAQIASFYAGAMSEAREIELGPVADRVGGLDLVLIGANDPAAMARHTAECRERGIPFAADPSQQVAWLSGEDIANLVDGAAYLFTNEYEASVVEKKTGWTQDEISARVEVRVTTLGAAGARVQRRGEAPIHVPVATVDKVLEPTGVGDAFRAGFLAGLTWNLGLERCAQLGSLLAAHVVETVGTQEYTLDRATFIKRFGAAYGADAAAEVEPHLPA